jgi:hypothetical protein
MNWKKLIRVHGVLAPNSSLREQVVASARPYRPPNAPVPEPLQLPLFGELPAMRHFPRTPSHRSLGSPGNRDRLRHMIEHGHRCIRHEARTQSFIRPRLDRMHCIRGVVRDLPDERLSKTCRRIFGILERRGIVAQHRERMCARRIRMFATRARFLFPDKTPGFVLVPGVVGIMGAADFRFYV